MRVLKPIILARRRQICAGPLRRGMPDPLFRAELPAEGAELFELREESRTFVEPTPVPREAVE